MALTISTNIASIAAQGTMTKTQNAMNKSFAQLSSGSRIIKSADDAAGLSISETLKSTIRGYTQAQRNANDGISMVQVAEGSLGEISDILTRLRELGVQASTDTVGDSERGFINKEVQHLVQEVDRIANTTRFGGANLIDGSGETFAFQVDINNDDFNDRITFDPGEITATADNLEISGFDFSDKDTARSALATLETSQRQVNGFRADLGAIQNRLISTSGNLGTSIENYSAANAQIRDADIAASTSELTKNQILLNASIGVLSQANSAPMAALKLLG